MMRVWFGCEHCGSLISLRHWDDGGPCPACGQWPTTTTTAIGEDDDVEGQPPQAELRGQRDIRQELRDGVRGEG